jgi:hypothetical protein
LYFDRSKKRFCGCSATDKGLTPKEIRNGIGVSKQGAMDLLNPLLQAGIVLWIGTRKSGRDILP